MATVKLLPRIRKELQILESDLPHGIICYPVDDNCTRFAAQIMGSKGTPYEDGTFKLDVQVTTRYPIEPPKVQFVTPIYHPNIDSSGRICLDALKMPPTGSWKPSLNISTVLISLSVLMGDPNPDDPLDVDIAKEYKENRSLFLHKARESTLKHAVDATETSTLSFEQHPTEPTATTSSSSSFSSSSSSIVLPPVSPSSNPASNAHKPDSTIEATATATTSITSTTSTTTTTTSSYFSEPSETSTSLTTPASSRLSLSKKKNLSRSHSARRTAPLVVRTPTNDVTPRSTNEAGHVQTDDVVETFTSTAKSADVAIIVKTDKKNKRRQQAAEVEVEAEAEVKAEVKAEVEVEVAKKDNESSRLYAVVADMDDDKENAKLYGAEANLSKGNGNLGLPPVEANLDKERKSVRVDAVKVNFDVDKENMGLRAVETNLHKDKENVESRAVETNSDKDKNVNLHGTEAKVVVQTDKTAAPLEQRAMTVTLLQKTAPLPMTNNTNNRKRKTLKLQKKETRTVTGGTERDEEAVGVKKLRRDECETNLS